MLLAPIDFLGSLGFLTIIENILRWSAAERILKMGGVKEVALALSREMSGIVHLRLLTGRLISGVSACASRLASAAISVSDHPEYKHLAFCFSTGFGFYADLAHGARSVVDAADHFLVPLSCKSLI